MRGHIRQLKPELAFDEEFWALVMRYPDLHLHHAWTHLWNHSDREGRFEWRPLRLKAHILPYWNGDFERVLTVLAEAGYVQRYEVNGRLYGVCRSFSEHQRPGNKEPASTIPEPPEVALLDSPQADLSQLKPGKATRERAHADPDPDPYPDPNPDPNPDQLEQAPPEIAPTVTEVRAVEPAAETRLWPPSKFVPKGWAPNDYHRVRCQELRLDVDELVRDFRNTEFKVEYRAWDKRFSKWIEERRVERETELAEKVARGSQTRSQNRQSQPRKERTYADLVAAGEVRE